MNNTRPLTVLAVHSMPNLFSSYTLWRMHERRALRIVMLGWAIGGLACRVMKTAVAGIFSLGYLIFQVPSNLVITKVGAPTWLGLLIFCWGIVAASTAAMKTKATFYVSE